MSNGFAAGEDLWRARLGTLRQVVRQELVARQLAGHLPPDRPAAVLDVGCGQGTQVLALARAGHRVTGLDSSATLLSDLGSALAQEAPEVRERVSLLCGDAARLTELVPPRAFDAVLCHGVLMYLDDPGPLLTALATAVAPDGPAVAARAQRRRSRDAAGTGYDWATALRAFGDMSYVNRIGVAVRADRPAVLTSSLARRGFGVEAWYGVRVFTDMADSDAPLPGPAEFSALLDCEIRAGSTDPYRQVAALLHVIARPRGQISS